MTKVKTKKLVKTNTEKILYGLFLLYAIAMTGLFLYGFGAILYALIFDQSALDGANFGYAEGIGL